MNRREATVAAAAAACITAVQCCKHETTRGNGREKEKRQEIGKRKEDKCADTTCVPVCPVIIMLLNSRG